MDFDMDALTEKIDGLKEDAASIKTELEGKSLDAEKVKELEGKYDEVSGSLNTLMGERAEAEAEAGRKALLDRVDGLEETFEHVGKAFPEFKVGRTFETDPGTYGKEGERSFFSDVLASRNGNPEARDRVFGSFENLHEGKAMGESVDAAGGFLVPPQLSNELITIRDYGSVIRPLFSSTSIEVDTLRFIAQDNGLAVAWTAEFAEKIQSEFKFSEFETHVYTAAGLAVASNQLLEDSRWALDQMIFNDLAKRFVSLEEQAFLMGTGEGQPLGIYNTPGVGHIAYKATASVPNLLDKIQAGITEIYTEFLAPPTAIVMHPRTWAYIVGGREATSPSTYLIGTGSSVFGRRGGDPIPGYGSASLPRGELFGYPVYCSPNVPTTLGTNTNESAIFIGDFSQGLVLDRHGIRTDVSQHVYFTSNQTVFRSEERLGFTAGRYPKAFTVIAGEGLEGV